jgi:cell wall-associated NlpC family hydrolase
MNSDLMVENAIHWAQNQLGSKDYPFRCLAFVEDAYEKGNEIEIFGGSTAKESADMYGLQTGADIPSRGAFVFYNCLGSIDGLHKNWGHVGLSCGNGKVIHAWDRVREDDYRAVEELQAAPGWTQPQYIGWTPVERILQGRKEGHREG